MSQQHVYYTILNNFTYSSIILKKNGQLKRPMEVEDMGFCLEMIVQKAIRIWSKDRNIFD
jgi:hypothetical protein